MIKVSTAHIVIGGITVLGAGTVLVSGIFGGISAGQIMSSTASGLGQFGGFVKTTGVIGLVITILILLVRFNIIRVLMIQEGETALLIRRGKVVISKKTQLPRILNPGRYQIHVAILRHIAIVSNRERVIDLGSLPVTIGGITWVVPLSLVWRIMGDPKSLRDALIRVSDGNRFDEKFGALENMVKEQCVAGLAFAFKQGTTGADGGPPIIDFGLVHEDVENRLKAYGCNYDQLLEAPMYRYADQHGKDGQLSIAEAIKDSMTQLSIILSSTPRAN
ncbi:MAG: hypothetical protein JWM00_117 [Candidatus Saccharibacteria bacterium]|nr:hypothetical protein [Candidatus Saccharibacteria bacterium]